MHRVNFFLLLLLGLIPIIAFVPVQVRFFAHKERPGVIFYRCGVVSWRLGIGGEFQLGFLTETPTEVDLEKEQVLPFLHQLPRIFQDIRKFSYLFRRFLKKGRFRQFHWRLFLGTTDYAVTGIVVGACWAVVESALSRASCYTKIEPSGVFLQIIPRFGEPCFKVEFDCIFETRLTHIIIELVRSSALSLLFNKAR